MGKQLRRTMGLWGTTATGVGIVVSSSALVSLGQGFGAGGKPFVFAMLAALILMVFSYISFTELAGMMPVAGGINHYTLPAMGPFVGIISVISGYFLVSIFSGAAEAAIAGMIFTDVFAPGLNPIIVAVIITVIIASVNVLGVKAYSSLQLALTIILIGSTVVLGILGLSGIELPGEPIDFSISVASETGLGVLGLTALAIWLFIGIEFITPLAEEIKRPNLTIPIAIGIGLVVIFIANILFGFASMKYVPLETLAGSASPHVVFATAMLGKTGQVWMGIVAIFATTSTMNTIIGSVARMLYGMGQRGQLPKFFGKLNRFGAPWVGVVFLSSLFLIFVISGTATGETVAIFILAGCFCWLVTYCIAHIDVMILRFKYPQAKRGFKSPFGITIQLLGLVGMIYVMLNMHPDAAVAKEIYKYSLLFLALTVLYAACWVKFKMKKPLFETVPLEELINDPNNKKDDKEKTA
ncbi:APC family permease [Pseudogracilibacillus auburnensis]|uniref:Amino acid/polyamine/organocation transporter (APC superfamily) n=1 Tax=Pseudogracilibacillus auburnensis TaxID=1494959 RepID=A0A2V3VZ42_9BACI|nr:APC family permease [Pseudogracilibacillus auburnensis]MBO1004424.1 APC family permease [Pseudogracilibacillus auburnensis]PXW87122.1 amino acid/polyamine/organocation transporter (APC superfamily) [Pseudogracilibacillus auburnensis]